MEGYSEFGGQGRSSITMYTRNKKKKQEVNKELCYALWGNHDVQWTLVQSEEPLGGILCLWDIC